MIFPSFVRGEPTAAVAPPTGAAAAAAALVAAADAATVAVEPALGRRQVLPQPDLAQTLGPPQTHAVLGRRSDGRLAADLGPVLGTPRDFGADHPGRRSGRVE